MADLRTYIAALFPAPEPEPEPWHPEDQERDEDPPEVFGDPELERAIATFAFVSFAR